MPSLSRKKKMAYNRTSEWRKLFEEDNMTELESLVFVKRLIAVVISSITYFRGIFPEDAYKSRAFEDMCIKILRFDCTTPGANKVVKWMMGCFEALEKRFLRILFVGVYTNPDYPNCFIESYQFNLKYTEKGPEMNILRNNAAQKPVTLGDTKRATESLIRRLLSLTQNLGSLPSGVYVTMKLFYFDNVTPEDYEPPGFKEGEGERVWFEGTAVHLKVGNVETPFHTLGVRVMAEQGRLAELREGDHVRESKRAAEVCQNEDEEDVTSEAEFAQFKKPLRPQAKRPKQQTKRKSSKKIK